MKHFVRNAIQVVDTILLIHVCEVDIKGSIQRSRGLTRFALDAAYSIVGSYLSNICRATSTITGAPRASRLPLLYAMGLRAC